MKTLKYIELKSGHSDNGPAWIGYVTSSKSGRTLYFNGRGLMKLKGQRRGESGGNYVDMETGESFWVSGVKKNGEDRHWAGSGKVLVEAAAVSEYLQKIGAKTLDISRCEVTNSIRQTDIMRLSKLANAAGRGWEDNPEGPYSFVRNVTLSAH
ncbi:MAG: mannose-1-phosphate guanylyltransferase [Terracidiphilus sp.]